MPLYMSLPKRSFVCFSGMRKLGFLHEGDGTDAASVEPDSSGLESKASSLSYSQRVESIKKRVLGLEDNRDNKMRPLGHELFRKGATPELAPEPERRRCRCAVGCFGCSKLHVQSFSALLPLWTRSRCANKVNQ